MPNSIRSGCKLNDLKQIGRHFEGVTPDPVRLGKFVVAHPNQIQVAHTVRERPHQSLDYRTPWEVQNSRLN